MKIIEKILKIITVIVLFTSIIYFTVSIVDFFKLSNCQKTFNKFYQLISTYSGVHKFSFVVLATYLGLNRLKVSKNEINRKIETEIKTETLKQCEYYFTDIQIIFKELVQNENYSNIRKDWSNLKEINSYSLEKNYNDSFEIFKKTEIALKGQSLITLYRLEAFSALFLTGNRDLELGKKIIGKTFVKQVEYLKGLIAFYRRKDSSDIFENILELYSKWK